MQEARTDSSSGSETGSSPQHSSESDVVPELENVPTTRVPTTPTLVHEDPVETADPATPIAEPPALRRSQRQRRPPDYY